MSASAWPDHLLTLAEWDELPEFESHHVELVEGILLVTPGRASRHQMAVKRLGTSLDAQLPQSVIAVPEVDVLVDPVPPVTVRAPDLVVVQTALALEYPTRYDADDVLVAVEVVSPGTGRTDRIVKPVEYADAGIPHYWLVELDDPITLTAFTLVDGDCEHVAGGTGEVSVPSPFPVALDLPTLLTR
ncbi:Uma2 family endonuclease [Actinosynnema sp. NPDC050436]|uniref:Uma2 family endonuclease n=1 Tax=Actinosynnema sp. NPDC050436 TaxID=3155659 RepID=UPI0033FD52BC